MISSAARAYSALVRDIPPTHRGDKKIHALHEVPPSSNTGERVHGRNKIKTVDAGIVLIDYLTFVIPASSYLEALPTAKEQKTKIPKGFIEKEIVERFISRFNREVLNSINLGVESLSPSGGRNGYDNSWQIFDSAGNVCGFVAYGGNKNKHGHETICVNISGSGTKCIGSFNYDLLYKILVEKGGHITRIDLAHDCFEGEISLIQVQNWYKAGLFRASAQGKYPDSSLWSDNGSGKGSTFYVGSRESGKLFRAYEKGKQLGDKNSKWVRLEVELRNKKRVIPLDILLSASAYISGTYKCMQFLNIKQSQIETLKKETKISFKHLEEYCSIAYGNFLNVMFEAYETSDEIIEKLRRYDGIPRRLKTSTIPVLN